VDFSAEDVLEVAARGEGRDTEFKRGLPGPAKIGRTLCAFANTRGGLLLVGITDRGEVYGVPQPRAVIESLRALARERLEPPLKLQLQAVHVGEETVVCCSVPLSPDRPHRVRKDDGRLELVVRAGSSNRVASGATLRALLQPHATKSTSPLERDVLAWVKKERNATVARFAKAHNVGAQRAKRAFVALERAGRLVGHGFGARRVFESP
jgi:predicted HTH transcriptional regulator